ncbi:trypsin-like serine peptidase [Haloglycomyces albus]|uniref:trypsin-like serine peptidase n=1 Tax=Haloglycomyces albus TaxID=526067 RepID=UPI00146FBA9B|nr:serine protease [Haloglycomyces albus]
MPSQIPGTGSTPSSSRRRRRKIVVSSLAAVVALIVAVTVTPNAVALRLGFDVAVGERITDSVDSVEVDDALSSVIQVGERISVDKSLDYDEYSDGNRVLEFVEEGASYVKVHFEKLALMDGDSLTVYNPDRSEVHTYTETVVDDWAMSVTGDRALVELSVHEPSVTPKDLGVSIDEVAYGYGRKAIDDIMLDHAASTRSPESNCGTVDRRPAPCYEDSHPTMVRQTDPVARLLVDGTVLCTAFKVSERNRLLTNNHCFSQDWEAKRTEVWFDYDCRSCTNTTPRTPTKVRGQSVIKTNRNLDYTLFSVSDFSAVDDLGHLELEKDRTRRGEEIYIPQHPGGRPTEIAVESSSDGGNCVVSGVGYDGYIEGTDVAYYCDTEFGSSGSPVLSSQSHKVVALHHFGGCPNSGVSSHLIYPEIKDHI